MNLNWTRPIPIQQYNTAPKKHGVYQIGPIVNGKFRPYYLGRACGKKVTIQRRLKSHYEGRSNKYVKNYLQRDGNLWINWCLVTNPAKTESVLLHTHGIGKEGRYKWNDRLEHYKSDHLGYLLCSLLFNFVKYLVCWLWSCCRKRVMRKIRGKKRNYPICRTCNRRIKGNHKMINNNLTCLK